VLPLIAPLVTASHLQATFGWPDSFQRPPASADNPTMALRVSLADFIEEELLRAPLTFDAVIDAVYEQWRQTLVVAGRDGGEVARMLQLHRGSFLAAALRTLRLAAQRSGKEAPAAAPPNASAARRRELSLVDEVDIVADLETGRCSERIQSEAEAELREMRAYTSALVGDHAVSRETNPFRPEHFALALWEGCQALPSLPAVRLDAYRRAAAPLVRGVRISLSAACQRLAAQGITPATYRTLVFAPTSTAQTPERVHSPPENLISLRDSMLGGLDAATTRRIAAERERRPLAHEAAAAAREADPQLALLMHRLYDEIGAEGGVPPEVVALLGELRPAFERIAGYDEAMVDRFDHPVWRFIDRLAFTVAATPPAERARLLGLGRNLIAHLAAEPTPDATRFAWAVDKLEAQDRQSVALAVHAASADIRRLMQAQAAAPSATAVSSGPLEEQLALDVESLDTVPGNMLAAPSASGEDGRNMLTRIVPGDRWRIFLQGEWRSLQLLWSHGDVWLLRDLAGGLKWALRAAAIERLITERLAIPLRMRSLVRRAAERMQQSL
jgi:hypothetical protein